MTHLLYEHIQRYKKMYNGGRGDAMTALASYAGYKNENSLYAVISQWRNGTNAQPSTVDRIENAIVRILNEQGIDWVSDRVALAEHVSAHKNRPKTEEEAIEQILGHNPMELKPLEAVLTNIERAAVIQGIMNNTEFDLAQKERILRILQPILALTPQSDGS